MRRGATAKADSSSFLRDGIWLAFAVSERARRTIPIIPPEVEALSGSMANIGKHESTSAGIAAPPGAARSQRSALWHIETNETVPPRRRNPADAFAAQTP